MGDYLPECMTAVFESALDHLERVEEQAKRVARAEKWVMWADASDEVDAYWDSVDALEAERCKLAEMVEEGES